MGTERTEPLFLKKINQYIVILFQEKGHLYSYKLVHVYQGIGQNFRKGMLPLTLVTSLTHLLVDVPPLFLQILTLRVFRVDFSFKDRILFQSSLSELLMKTTYDHFICIYTHIALGFVESALKKLVLLWLCYP